MKAITLWQPWASLLACGAKKYETRSWCTTYRGPIAIHAALKEPQKLYDALPTLTQFVMSEMLLPLFVFWDSCPCGCIIAIAELVGCRRMHKNPMDGVTHILDDTDAAICIEGNELLLGDWTPGRYAWELANVKMLDKPIPAKGKQGLWNWEPPTGWLNEQEVTE